MSALAAAWAAPAGLPPGDRATLFARLASCLELIEGEQLPTGEVPSYLRSGGGQLEYRRSPLVSTLVHDALGAFDPRSPWMEPEALDWIPDARRTAFVRRIVRVRRRLRAFVAWQEECDGTWRILGRGSGVEADATTTARAATVLLERAFPSPRRPWRRHVEALSGLGPFHEPVDEAEASRFLALVGEETGARLTRLLDGLEHKDPFAGSERFPNPYHFPYVLTRAWGQAQLPGSEVLRDRLLPSLLARQGPQGDFGGPLSTALAAATMLELEHRGGEVERARLALLRRINVTGGWDYEGFLPFEGGSHVWTTALGMSVLVRASAAEEATR